jgi:hypothetical protein
VALDQCAIRAQTLGDGGVKVSHAERAKPHGSERRHAPTLAPSRGPLEHQAVLDLLERIAADPLQTLEQLMAAPVELDETPDDSGCSS